MILIHESLNNVSREAYRASTFTVETDIYRKIRASLKSFRAYGISLMEGVT